MVEIIKDWSTLKKLIFLKATGVAGAAWRTVSGAIVSFVTQHINPLKSLVVNIEPIQSGTGDPSPDNVRPILGRTGATVTRTGKNLFDKSAITPNSWIVVDTTEIESASLYFVTDYIPVSTNIRIRSNLKGSSRNIYYDVNKNPIAYFTWSSGTLTPLYDGYVRCTAKNEYLDALQIEYSSKDTTYEPYTGTTIPVSWETEARTVYGGSLDVVSGVLTVDRAMVNLGTLSWVYNTTYAFFTSSSLTDRKIGVTNMVSDLFQTRAGSWSGTPLTNAIWGNGSNATIYVQYPITEVSEFLSLISGHQLCYELAEPIIYQLTPQQIQTLLGDNVVWSDAGDVSVTYAQ